MKIILGFLVFVLSTTTISFAMNKTSCTHVNESLGLPHGNLTEDLIEAKDLVCQPSGTDLTVNQRDRLQDIADAIDYVRNYQRSSLGRTVSRGLGMTAAKIRLTARDGKTQ